MQLNEIQSTAESIVVGGSNLLTKGKCSSSIRPFVRIFQLLERLPVERIRDERVRVPIDARYRL